MKISALVAWMALLAIAAPAFATNLVVNGGFESGDASTWTAIGNNATPYNYTYTGNPHDGSFDYRDGNYPEQGWPACRSS